MNKRKNGMRKNRTYTGIGALIIVLLLAVTGVLEGVAGLVIGLLTGAIGLIVGLVGGGIGLVVGLVAGVFGLVVALVVGALGLIVGLLPILIPIVILAALVRYVNREEDTPIRKRKHDDFI